jgi:glycine/D-amino acid oxidase-like deaminating enzyme
VITGNALIIAAGAWSQKIGEMIRAYLPVEPVRRQIGMTEQRAEPFRTVPFTPDLSTTLYFHNYRNGLLLGISNADEEPGFCGEFRTDGSRRSIMRQRSSHPRLYTSPWWAAGLVYTKTPQTTTR